jgi:hypothetical protein
MDIESITQALQRGLVGFDVYERRPGNYQLIVPICHEDGDMVDVYLQDSPKGADYVRIRDFGLTLMRLSYTFEVSTPTRQQLLDSILANNGVSNDNGDLYLDTPLSTLYESMLQFVGCTQKVCNMRYWNREIIRSTFYDDLRDCITSEMTVFSPRADQFPMSDYPISVDWQLTHNNRNFYVFGVGGNDKAKNVAISLLEFQKTVPPFISLIVHEDMEALGRKERLYLTRNADTQYPVLGDFKEKGTEDIRRLAA